MAKKAIQFGNEKFALKLLDQEKSALKKIPQLLELNKIINCLDICFGTFDFNILSIVLKKIKDSYFITKLEDEDLLYKDLCNPELQKHHQKIMLFFKLYMPDKYEYFLEETKDYNELFCLKLAHSINSLQIYQISSHNP